MEANDSFMPNYIELEDFKFNKTGNKIWKNGCLVINFSSFSFCNKTINTKSNYEGKRKVNNFYTYSIDSDCSVCYIEKVNYNNCICKWMNTLSIRNFRHIIDQWTTIVPSNFNIEIEIHPKFLSECLIICYIFHYFNAYQVQNNLP